MNAQLRRRFASAALIIGFFVFWELACIAIIGSATYLVVIKGSVDGPLKEWASTCLGFLFATFVSMVKDFIKINE